MYNDATSLTIHPAGQPGLPGQPQDPGRCTDQTGRRRQPARDAPLVRAAPRAGLLFHPAVGRRCDRRGRCHQRVFLSVWRQAHQFRARSSVSTRLLAIARNKAIAELRRRRGEALGEEVAAIEDPQHDPRQRCRPRTAARPCGCASRNFRPSTGR